MLKKNDTFKILDEYSLKMIGEKVPYNLTDEDKFHEVNEKLMKFYRKSMNENYEKFNKDYAVEQVVFDDEYEAFKNQKHAYYYLLPILLIPPSVIYVVTKKLSYVSLYTLIALVFILLLKIYARNKILKYKKYFMFWETTLMIRNDLIEEKYNIGDEQNV